MQTESKSNERSARKSESGLTKTEARAAVSLAGIFSLRMLGLFMIYPVFAVFATKELRGATPATIGVALGIYGLSQAALQIPFGMLSDRLGRKRIILTGLLIFAAGSVVAALSHTIYGVIVGRLLQGGGAVGSALLALIADLTREEQRTKAMAIVGMTIGMSFVAGMALGPIVNLWDGVSGIFWLTAMLACLGIGVLYLFVPNPVQSRLHREAEPVPALFRRVLKNGELLRLDYGILSAHAVLTAMFLGLPLVLRESAGLGPMHQTFFYVPVLVVAIFLMVPPIIIAEKHHRMKEVFLCLIAVLGLAQVAVLFWQRSLIGVGVALALFFGAFTAMEALLPSLISKVAPADSKGTAMGVYSSSQFFGIFLGGALGGLAQSWLGLEGLFGFTALMAFLWFMVAVGMSPPSYFSSRLLKLGQITEEQAERLATQLRQMRGVAEAVVIAEEGVAYLKVDSKEVDEAALGSLSAQGS